MRTLLTAIATATQSLQVPAEQLKFNIHAGAGNSVSTLASSHKIKATYTQLVNIFGAPFFDALENPMETGQDVSASWEFSDSNENVYTLSDNLVGEKVDSIPALRETTQDWTIGASYGNAHPDQLQKLITKKLQEN